MGSLVIELQKVAINSDKKVSNLLMMSLLLTKKLKLDQFEKWVNCELFGYEEDVSVPAYRKIRGQLMVNNPHRGGLVPLHEGELEFKKKFGKLLDINYRKSIHEIESSILAEGTICIPLPSELFSAGVLDGNPFGFPPMELVICLSKFHLQIVLDHVRSEIVQWSGNLEQKGILGEGMSFSPEEEKKATEAGQTINYNGCNIVNNPSGTVTQQIGDHNQILSEIRNNKELSPEVIKAFEDLFVRWDAAKEEKEAKKSISAEAMKWVATYVSVLSDPLMMAIKKFFQIEN